MNGGTAAVTAGNVFIPRRRHRPAAPDSPVYIVDGAFCRMSNAAPTDARRPQRSEFPGGFSARATDAGVPRMRCRAAAAALF